MVTIDAKDDQRRSPVVATTEAMTIKLVHTKAATTCARTTFVPTARTPIAKRTESTAQ